MYNLWEKHRKKFCITIFKYKKYAQSWGCRKNVPNVVFRHFWVFNMGKTRQFKGVEGTQHCYVTAARYARTAYSPLYRKIH